MSIAMSPDETLATRLHAATTVEHRSLNRMITSRLPLALEPNTTTPMFYVAGMTVFGQIYRTFEDVWDVLLAGDRTEGPICDRHLCISRQLKTTHLSRSSRLNNDIRRLSDRHVPHQSSVLASLHGPSRQFSDRIKSSLSAKPHLLLAYTWTMYLALFNGGRVIVRPLQAAGPDFWRASPGEDLSQTCLSFWFFDDTTHDRPHGEDVKAEFKQNFAAAAALLTPEEEDEVIQESKMLFQMCADMVELLDQHVAGDRGDVETHDPSVLSFLSTQFSAAWRTLKSATAVSTIEMPPTPGPQTEMVVSRP